MAHQLRTVQHGGRHLLSLINDLLDLARIESGKLELHPEPIDCPELLEEVFTDTGSVRLELTQRPAGNRSVTSFAVIDTGRGIAPKDHARLFAAFEQIKNADAPAQEGTGLGLHISQALAVRIGGNIRVESARGEGSTFALEVAGPSSRSQACGGQT